MSSLEAVRGSVQNAAQSQVDKDYLDVVFMVYLKVTRRKLDPSPPPPPPGRDGQRLGGLRGMRGASEVKVSQVTLPYLPAVRSDVITKVNKNRYSSVHLAVFTHWFCHFWTYSREVGIDG